MTPAGPADEAPEGLLLVDKPGGCTSHDVVGRVRWLLGTRRVGHAGTLDPMATGLLVLGVGRATKLLGRLALTDKVYRATIRLGRATVSDDAEGEILPGSSASAAGVDEPAVRSGIAALTGSIAQRPSAVSAIKVDGQRAHDLVRGGVTVELAARPVRVSDFRITAPLRRVGDLLDVDVEVACSTGTYIRALARDLGADLGVGGHLTALRRVSSGPFAVADAVDVYGPDGVPARGERRPRPAGPAAAVRDAVRGVDEVARRIFPVREVSPDEARDVRFGRPIAPTCDARVTAVYAGGMLLALVADRDGLARPELVWAPA